MGFIGSELPGGMVELIDIRLDFEGLIDPDDVD
jgi:hypothetical protein